MTDWCNYYSFDVMGDLSFGKSFNMLRDGIKHYFMRNLHANVKILGVCALVPWVLSLLKSIPVLNSDFFEFWRWTRVQVEERRQVSTLSLSALIPT